MVPRSILLTLRSSSAVQTGELNNDASRTPLIKVDARFVADIAGAASPESFGIRVGGHLGALGWTHENVRKL